MKIRFVCKLHSLNIDLNGTGIGLSLLYRDFWFMQYMLILDGESTVGIRDIFIQLGEEFSLTSCRGGVC